MRIRRCLASLALCAGAALVGPTPFRGTVPYQPSFVLVRVLERETGRGLPNAEVTELGSGTRLLTDQRGEARLTRPDGKALRVRVRQLGFRAAERAVEQGVNAPVIDTITFALDRVPFVMPGVITTAANLCGREADSLSKTLSLPALEHLRFGAERYEAFRRAYPFRVRVERRTVMLDAEGKPASVRVVEEAANSEKWGESYRPGRVVERTAAGFSVPILFVSALADRRFWERHCFAVRGVQSLAGYRVLRLEFTPTHEVRGPDWAGTAFTDSVTSLLRRVEFQLVGLGPGDVPRRLEGYTTFASPSPFIAIPESTVAVLWRGEPAGTGEWGTPTAIQLLHVRALEYRKARPP